MRILSLYPLKTTLYETFRFVTVVTVFNCYPRMRYTVTAIIPAYNEAPRIKAVLDVITTYPGFDEIVVSDDGSTDNLKSVVQQYPSVRYLRLFPNQGKGYAMEVAVQHSRGDILFFCDADVRGLTHELITATLAPLQRGEVEMCIAMRNRKIYYLRFVLRMIPLLGGERALTRRLWEKIPQEYKQNFKIEAALNFFAEHEGKGFTFKVFPGLSQTIKEKKMGLLPGMLARWRMIREVAAAELEIGHRYVRKHATELREQF